MFGPSGMLGKHVMRAATAYGLVPVPVHRRMFDCVNAQSIRHVLEENGIEGVINCAGVIPVKTSSIIEMIHVNATFPHLLCYAAGEKPVILVSTDCVFSGRNRYKYKTEDIPDPRDYYGATKRLGEVVAPNAMVVRTSFIGCEHGLMRFVLNAGQAAKAAGQPVRIEGWKNALWTGSTVQAVAHSLIEMLTRSFNPGVAHLSTDLVRTKFDVISKLVELNEFDVIVEPVHYPIFCRALLSTHPLQDVYEALDEYKCVDVRQAA